MAVDITKFMTEEGYEIQVIGRNVESNDDPV